MRSVKSGRILASAITGWQYWWRCPVRSSRKDALHKLAMHVREPELAALEFEGEALMIDSEKVHDGGLKVMHMNLVLHRAETEVVGLAVADAGFDATAGHPDGEAVRMMVTAPLLC